MNMATFFNFVNDRFAQRNPIRKYLAYSTLILQLCMPYLLANYLAGKRTLLSTRNDRLRMVKFDMNRVDIMTVERR